MSSVVMPTRSCGLVTPRPSKAVMTFPAASSSPPATVSAIVATASLLASASPSAPWADSLAAASSRRGTPGAFSTMRRIVSFERPATLAALSVVPGLREVGSPAEEGARLGALAVALEAFAVSDCGGSTLRLSDATLSGCNRLDREAQRPGFSGLNHAALLLALNRVLDDGSGSQVPKSTVVVARRFGARARQCLGGQHHPGAHLAAISDSDRKFRITRQDTDTHPNFAAVRKGS